jgi:hypothetical protein
MNEGSQHSPRPDMAPEDEFISDECFPGQPGKEEIIHLCRQKGPTSNGLKYPPNGTPIAYIKYGRGVTMGEAWAQLYAFEQMKDQLGAKIPRIYRAFQDGCWTFILMEYIEGKTVGELLQEPSADHDWIYNQVADAVRQMLGFPVPEGVSLGPIGGGCAQHCFFKDHVAPMEYPSVPVLEKHINKVPLNALPCWCTLIS